MIHTLRCLTLELGALVIFVAAGVAVIHVLLMLNNI